MSHIPLPGGSRLKPDIHRSRGKFNGKPTATLQFCRNQPFATAVKNSGLGATTGVTEISFSGWPWEAQQWFPHDPAPVT